MTDQLIINLSMFPVVEWAKRRIRVWDTANDPDKLLDLKGFGLQQLYYPEIIIKARRFDCSDNRLTSFPDELRILPNCQKLYCYNNQLTGLPELPNCTELYCFANELTTIPDLPNCRGLCGWENQLIHLPKQLPSDCAIHCHQNPYLHITKEQALKYRLRPTRDFTSAAKKIQKCARRQIMNKIIGRLDGIYPRDILGLIVQYMI